MVFGQSSVHVNTMATQAKRKPCKQQRISQEHATVVASVESVGFSCEPHVPRTNNILYEVLGRFPSGIMMTWDEKLQCFQHLLTSLQSINISSIEYEQWKQIHGYLVLHLGNNTRIPGISTISTERKIPVYTTICQCLRQIYLHFTPQYTIFSKEEIQVAFELLVQLALKFTLKASVLQQKADTSETTNKDPILGFIKILLDLCHTMMSKHTPGLETVEFFFVFLTRVIFQFSQQHQSNGFVTEEAQDLLQELAFISNAQIAERASWAMAAVAAVQQKTDVDLQQQSVSLSDRLLFWRCLAQSADAATKLSQTVHILDLLVDVTVGHDMACAYSAADFLTQIAIHRKMSASQDAIIVRHQWSDPTQRALLEILVSTQLSNLLQSIIIFGLNYCSPQTMPWDDAGIIQKMVSRLMKISIEKVVGHDNQVIEEETRTGAAIIFLRVIDHVILTEHKRPQSLPPMSYSQAIDCLCLLFRSKSDVVLNLAIDILEREVQRDGLYVALNGTQAISELASLSCCPHTSAGLKHKNAVILEIVTQNNEALGIVARQGKILEAVVIAASSQVEDPSANLTKNLALEVLMRLADDVCNRRVLAKQIGLIACMIRYARAMSNPNEHLQQQNNDEEEPPVRLVDLKQKIMDLAIAL